MKTARTPSRAKRSKTRIRRQLDTWLTNLTQAQLIRLLELNEAEYIFKHALVQDTVHSSLLHSERKRLHRMVGDSLKQLNPNALDEIAALLAQHYAEAGDSENTLEFATRAGDAAARRYAHPEARIDYARALDALYAMPDTDENRRKQVDLLIKQVSVSLRHVGPQTTLERMQRAEQLLATVPGDPSDRPRLARIYYWIGHAYVHGNQPGKSIEYMQRVLPIAQELHDADLLAIPASVIGRALAIQGKLERAEALLTEALESLEKVENWHEWILAKGTRAWVLAARGSPALGIAEARLALERATAVQTQTGVAQAHIALALVYLIGGEWQHALAQAGLTHEFAVGAGDELFLGMSNLVLALAHLRGGEFEAGERNLAELEPIRARLGGGMVLNLWLIAARVSSLVQQERTREAYELAEQSRSAVQASGDVFGMGLIERAFAQVAEHTAPPQWDDADAHFAESLKLFQENDARLEAARTRVAWGESLQRRGDINAARDHFQNAAAQFGDSGLERELEAVRHRLAV